MDKMDQAADKSKTYFDKGLRSNILEQGDRVLVRNLSVWGGPGRLRSYWEDKIDKVLRQMSDESPVCAGKAEDGTGRTRVLHRNLLLQCNFFPLTSVPRKKLRTRKELNQRCVPKSIYTLTNYDEVEEATLRTSKGPVLTRDPLPKNLTNKSGTEESYHTGSDRSNMSSDTSEESNTRPKPAIKPTRVFTNDQLGGTIVSIN